jgi:hypothetical protein
MHLPVAGGEWASGRREGTLSLKTTKQKEVGEVQVWERPRLWVTKRINKET